MPRRFISNSASEWPASPPSYLQTALTALQVMPGAVDTDPAHLPVRLLGMGVSGLESQPTQSLLFDVEARQKQRQLDEVADRIKERFGNAALGRASGLAHDAQRKPRL